MQSTDTNLAKVILKLKISTKNKILFSVIVLLGSFIFFSSYTLALKIPPKPQGYINDYAQIISPSIRQQLETYLANFEAQTSTQIVVVTFESLEEESLEDYSIRLAEKWKIGGQKHDNGAILLIFLKERKVRIEVGYGLEGVLTDTKSGLIIRNEITPFFRKANYNQGIVNAIKAIVAVTKGEYRIPIKRYSGSSKNFTSFIYLLLIFFAFILPMFFRRHYYKSHGFYSGGFGYYGGGFRGGFGGFGGGGGFSGGGGGFGGGGASGGW